ncbi:MAG TPA: immunoglobulin domain-containing protein, partial [Verrucomicrobiae bacterium]
PMDVTTNVGSKVVFTVNATGATPLGYRWWRMNGSTNTSVSGGNSNSLVFNNVTITDAGNYFAVVTNSVGSVTSRVATLTLDGVPVIIIPPRNQTNNLGSNATFSVVADGPAPLNYQWFFNTTNVLIDATNTSYIVSNMQATDAGGYSVIITNVAGSVTSSVATLTVRLPPAITNEPMDVTTNVGSKVVFTVNATGATPLGYRWWRMNGSTNTSVSGGNSNSMVFKSVTITNAGNYFAVVTNSVGSVTSRVATLTVLVVQPTITNQPVNVITNQGATVVFSVGASGSPPFSYQWWFNNTNLAGTSNPLVLNNVTTNVEGNYFVILTNNFGSATSQVATLIVAYQSLTPAQLWLLGHSGTSGDALMIAMEAGKNYRIQATTNLHDWYNVTNFLSSSTLMNYTNSLATNTTMMFYRIGSP